MGVQCNRLVGALLCGDWWEGGVCPGGAGGGGSKFRQLNEYIIGATARMVLDRKKDGDQVFGGVNVDVIEVA